jgi:hypothetical protein
MQKKNNIPVWLMGVFGPINPPSGVEDYGSATAGAGGLTLFLGNLLKTVIVLGSLYGVLNIIMAGYGYISAGGDPKKIAAANNKITMTFVGLAIATGAFLIAGIISRFVYGDPTAIFGLRIFGP